MLKTNFLTFFYLYFCTFLLARTGAVLVQLAVRRRDRKRPVPPRGAGQEWRRSRLVRLHWRMGTVPRGGLHCRQGRLPRYLMEYLCLLSFTDENQLSPTFSQLSASIRSNEPGLVERNPVTNQVDAPANIKIAAEDTPQKVVELMRLTKPKKVTYQ